MKTLTRILGVITIAGALSGLLGYATKNEPALALGVTGFTLGGVGYIIAKSNENDKNYK